ncbi:hypothetical protein FNYG_02364 [Fusarium nygamai]|uniref:Methyltransferase type 11 domain-containing protein n=1 Tax=Gibberella nygamai TaxID=42673 RepID=A0A2K0WPT9_GIBNY|nr:hypothetical protein FNYG_02364 [Fusarium nygamai]
MVLDFADENPNIEVIGIDLTDFKPTWVPPNLSFEVVGCLGLGNFDVSSQDFVHLRDLKGRIGNWGEFVKEVFNVLKPGGVAEFHESNIEFQSKAELPKDSYMKEWGNLFREAGAKRGARFDVVESGLLLSSLRAAGFSDIEEYLYEVPIERWQQRGQLERLGWLERVCDIEGSILRPAVEDLKWTEQQCYVFAAHLRRELKKTTVKPYTRRLVVVCKKPST